MISSSKDLVIDFLQHQLLLNAKNIQESVCEEVKKDLQESRKAILEIIEEIGAKNAGRS